MIGGSADRIVGTFAATGFVLSLAAHLIALGHTDISEYIPGVWLLHAAIFPPFALLIIALRRDDAAAKLILDIYFKAPPRLAALAIIALFFYVSVSSIIFFDGYRGGPGIARGKYILTNKGKLIEEINEADYQLHRARIMREFSGGWMVFFAVPALYFLTRKKA